MMKLENNTFTIEKKPYIVYRLLLEGKTQVEIAKQLGHSRAYVCQTTKKLVSFGLIKHIHEPLRSYHRKYTSLDHNYNIVLKEYPINLLKPLETKKPISYKGRGRPPIFRPRYKKCKQCGKSMKINRSSRKRKFCSQKCRGIYQSGPRSPQWKNGKTYIPYCWRFNKDLKLRVRAFFEYKCFICGEIENGTVHRVHHIKYNKMACCDGGGDPYMVPLCERCHNTTTPIRNRELWEKLLYNQLMERTGGKCFFTKEEWLSLHKKEEMFNILQTIS